LHAPERHEGTLLIPVNSRTTESEFGDWLVEQQELLLVGRLKDRCTLLKVTESWARQATRPTISSLDA